jgi:hypothetical protein
MNKILIFIAIQIAVASLLIWGYKRPVKEIGGVEPGEPWPRK